MSTAPIRSYSPYTHGGGIAALMLSAALTLVVVPAKAVSPAKKARAAFAKAEKAWEAKDYAAATKWLEEAVRLHPRSEYVYNYARALEKLGRLGDAHRAYLRVVAGRRSRKALRKLARAGAVQLEPFVKKAVVRMAAVRRDGMVLQLDDRVVSGQTDVTLSAGKHHVCWIPTAGGEADCWLETFRAGHRVDALTRPQPKLFATIRWDERAADQIGLDGYALILKPGELRSIRVAPGEHVLSVVRGGVTKRIKLTAPLGKSVTPNVGEEAAEPQPVPALAASASGTQGSQVWPWVVTGIGAALVGGGIGLFVAGGGEQAIDTETVSGKEVSAGPTQTEHAEAWDTGQTLQFTGGVLIGLGAAATIGGILWWALAPSNGTAGADAVRVRPRLLLGVRHVGMEVRF